MCNELKSAFEVAFTQARLLVESEDNLVNNRLGWTLTFNGFLFAAYMVTLLAEIEINNMPACQAVYPSDCLPSANNKVDFLRMLLGGVGLLSAVFSILGISAAFRAITVTVKKYEKFISENKSNSSKLTVEYDIAGDCFPNLLGMVAPLGLCFLMASTWVVLLNDTVGYYNGSSVIIFAGFGSFLAILLILFLIKCQCGIPSEGINAEKETEEFNADKNIENNEKDGALITTQIDTKQDDKTGENGS